MDKNFTPSTFSYLKHSTSSIPDWNNKNILMMLTDIMKKNYASLLLVCLLFFAANVFGQTNPTAQSLPYSFTSLSGTTLPTGMAAHRFGTSAGAIPTTRTTIVATGDLPNGTGTSGGWGAETTSGISMLASGSQSAGAIVVAIVTTGLTNIQVSWKAGTILQQASYDASIALQYRVGTSGTWTDVGTTTTYTSAGKTAGDVSGTLTETLPAGAENQSVVQVRWIYWISAGASGSRDRLNVDEISITGTSATNLYWGGTTGTYSGAWTTGNPWGTTTSSGATTAWPSSGSYNANFNATTSGIATVPTSISVVPNNTILNATTTFNTAAATNGTLSSTINLNSNTLTTAPVTSTTLTLSGVISGTGSITQNDAGTTTLSGANTYTGPTTINSGVLSISSIANGGSASNLGQSTNAAGNLVLGGGTLQYTGSTASTDRNFTLTAATTSTIDVTNALTISGASASTTGALTKAGAGTLTLSASNAYTGATTINAGTLQLGATTNTLSTSTAVTLANTSGAILDVNGKTQTIASLAGGGGTGGNVSLGAGSLTVSGSSTYSGVISGTGTLTKSTSGTLTLAGANTYSGATTISGGTLQLGAAGSGANTPLGTTAAGTSVSATGAALDLNGFTLATAEGLTLNGTGVSSGGALTNSSGTAVSYSGNITLGSASSIGTTGNITLSGVVSGAFALTKVGAGTLILSGANTYSGGTNITAGTVQLNPSATLSSGACTFNGTGATLSTTGITAGRAITFSSLAVTENATINLDNTNAHTLTFTTGSITSGKMLTITGWQGTYGVSNTGSKGKIYFGSTGTTLDCANLGRIQFFDGTTNYAVALKSDGELVPVKTPTVTSISPTSATAGDAGFTITVDGTNFISGISTVTWGGSARATTFVSATQLTATILTADLVTATTVQVGVSNGCVSSTSTQTFTINAPSNAITTTAGSFGPFCNGVSNNVTLTFSKTGTFTGQYDIQISDASGNFPSDATTQLLTYVSSTSTTVTATIPSGFTAGTGYKIRVVNNTPTYFSSGDNGSTIAVNATPTTPSCSTPAAACQGNAVTITGAGSTGATTYTYWTAAAPGGTQITTGGGYTVSGGNLTTPSSLAGGTYDFYVQAENAALCSSLARQKVTVTINSLPADPTGSIGVSANPSCGPATLNYTTGYYWETSTSDFTTAGRGTATNYTLNSTGTMYVRAYDGTCWSANTINTGTVTINTAISIGASPSDQAVNVPATATFGVSGVTGTVFGYQWQVNMNDGNGWNDISGAISSSYTTGATSVSMSGYKYHCIVKGTSPCSDVTSSDATLTVTLAPGIIYQHDFGTTTPGTPYTATPTIFATNLSSSSWTCSGTFINAGGSAGQSLAVASTGSGPYTLTFNVASGFQVDVTSFSMWTRTSNSATWAMTINGISVGSGNANTGSGANTGTLAVSNAVSGLTGTITVVISLGGTGSFRADDFTLIGYVTPICTAPGSQASSITTSAITSTGLDAGFTRGSGAGTILVIKPTAQTTVLPAANTSYSASPDWSAAGQINTNNRVIANSTATASSVVAVTGITNLTAETQYTLTAYERSSGNCYNTTSAPTVNFYTLSLEPVAHPASFAVDACAANNSLTLNFTAASSITYADGYVILRKQGGTAPTLTGIEDGKDPGSWTLPSGTTVVTTTNSSATAYTDNSLAANTLYSYLIIPYNADATPHAGTYNYYIGGTPKTTSGTTTNVNATSTITAAGSFSYPTDIDYTQYHGNGTPSGTITSTGNSVGVYGITLTDGSGDGKPTILKSIKINVNTIAQNEVARYALFSGNSLISGTEMANPGTSVITFSGLNITTTTDGGTVNLTLRVTFPQTVSDVPSLTAINDHDQLSFSVTNADVTADCGNNSSQFSSFTTVSSQTDGHKNWIGVTATKLTFSNVNDGAINVNLPPFTITATDNNGLKDLDANGTITLDCPDDVPNGDMSVSGGPYSLTNGLSSSITGVQFASVQTGIHITASIATPSINGTSNAFDINLVSYAYNAYLSTTATGTYGSANTWCRCQNTGGCSGTTPGQNGWNNLTDDAGVPSSGSTVYVQGNVTGGTSGATNLTILSGGVLTVSNNYPVSNSLTVKTGGKLYLNYGTILTIATGKDFIVEDNADVYVNYAYNGKGGSHIWKGNEKFYPQSNFYINNWDPRWYLVDEDEVSAYTDGNGYSALFGNIYIDPKITPSNAPEVTDYNSNGFGRDNWNMIGASNTSPVNLTNGNLVFVRTPLNVADQCGGQCGTVGNAGYKIPRIMSDGSTSFVVNIKGDLKLESTYLSAATIANRPNFTLNVLGNVDINSPGALWVRGNSGTGTTTLAITGNLLMNGAGTSSATRLYINQGSYNATNSSKTIINLKGNLSVGTNPLILSSCPPSDAEFNFTGTTTQLVDVGSVLASSGKGIPFNIKSGATVQLKNNDFKYTSALSTTTPTTEHPSSLNVESGGTLDFNWKDDGTPLTVVGAATINKFSAAEGSTLKITSPQGIVKNTSTYGINVGNVTGFATSNRDYNQMARYWYTGKSNSTHYTGDGINQTGATNGFGKVVICDLADNTKVLTPTVSFALTNDASVFSGGGRLDIRKGQFIETVNEYITGSTGTLYMLPGTLYKIVKGDADYDLAGPSNDAYDTPIPRMSAGTYPYVLTGGTIELAGGTAGNYFQVLRGQNGIIDINYHNVTFSGSNTLGTDFKGIPGTITITDSLYIKENAIVDCRDRFGTAASFEGSGGLVMDGGRIRIKDKTSVQPRLLGTIEDYKLTGGIVEFYGSGATDQQQIRGSYGSPAQKVNYYNVEINAVAANYSTAANAGNVDLNSSFTLSNIMNVNSPAVLRMDKDESIDGGGTFNIKDGAGLLYGGSEGTPGSAIEGLEADASAGVNSGNIRTTNRSFSSLASYGFVSPGNMPTGSGLPSTVKGLYVYKSSANDRVTLTNSVRADDILKMSSGHIVTGSNRIELGKDVSNKGTLDYTTGYVVGNMRRWFSGLNSGDASGSFPLGEDVSGTLYNRKFLIEYQNTPPSSGGYLDVNFNHVSMGTIGISSIPQINGSCPFYVTSTEDQGYWIGTPQTSTLNDGTYKLALTGEGFTTINNLCQLTLLKRVLSISTDWTAPGNHIEPAGSPSSPIVSRNGLSGFSNFGFGGGPPNPLPVELTSFTGSCLEDGISRITWSTVSELNSKEFIVQRSEDGIHYTSVAVVPAAGFSNQPINYSITDTSVYANSSYYRLIEVDNNGKQTIYSFIQVKCNEVNGVHIYYTQPKVVVEVNSTKDKPVAFNVYEVSGKLIHQESRQVVRGYNRFDLGIKNKLADGIYIIQMIDGDNVNSTKVIVH